MNRRMVLYTLGQMIVLESALMILPLAVSAIYRESCAFAFLITIAVALAIGLPMQLLAKPKNTVIYAKEGFVIVALTWLVLSAVGALPFFISREIPAYIDAFFETVSGFTTTGSSILTNVEALSHGMLFWRSFTHWVGGMGIIVFIMAIIPKTTDRSMHILRAEVPGPIVGKLVPKIKDTAKILYLIYVAMTALEVVMLLCGGMNLFEALVHSFGTAGTGGFGIKADCLASYNHYLQWVIAVFMLLFGINFNVFYMILIRHFKAAFTNRELIAYLSLVLVSSVAIGVNIYPIYNNVADSARESFFQVSSIITTTGYSTANFDQWPVLSKGILLSLMFIGGCAGSTAGGLKVSRIMLMVKMIRNELRRMLHPRAVGSVKLDGKSVDNSTLNNISVYFSLYALIFFIVFIVLCFEPFDLITHISAAAACFNNVGPGFSAVGPAASFAGYSPFAKFVLSIAMLLGRLEIYPMIFAFSPSTWAKK